MRTGTKCRSFFLRAGVSLLSLVAAMELNAANAWKMNLPVDSVVTLPSGGFILILPASDPACGPSGNQFYVQSGVNAQTVDGVKVALAVALMAYSTGKTVNVIADTTIEGCPVQTIQLNP